jgi:hypothetical protein
MNKYFIVLDDGVIIVGIYTLTELEKEHPLIYKYYMFNNYGVGEIALHDKLNNEIYFNDTILLLETEYEKEVILEIMEAFRVRNVFIDKKVIFSQFGKITKIKL